MTKRSKLDVLLRKLGACGDAREWAKGRTLAKAWRECERADWMLWLVGKMIGEKGWPKHHEVVLAACDCAETALQFVPKGDERPAKAIATARAWAEGKATIEEVRTADSAAYAAANAADAAANAAYAAAYAADSAADAAYAAYAAANAADSAAYAADSAANAARKNHLAKLAKIVRRRLKVPSRLGGLRRGKE